MMEVTLPRGTQHALRELTGEARPDVALLLVLRDAAAYRLEQIEAGMRTFEQKYGMSWEAFRRRWDAEDREADFAWESERDFLEWEGLVTRKSRLEALYGWLP